MRWVPLEANPEVLNTFAGKLGVDLADQGFGFQDVYGLDDELLMMVPQPVLAVILLYPLTEELEEKRLQDIQEDAYVEEPGGPLYMKQTIGNACGTIALLHSLGNAMDVLSCGGFLHQFLENTKDYNHKERGEYLEHGEGASSLEKIHAEAAHAGETRAPSVDEEINLHFVAFVEHNEGLWELDGRKAGPVYHGETDRDSLLQRVAQVVKKEYIETSDSLDFNMMALAALD